MHIPVDRAGKRGILDGVSETRTPTKGEKMSSITVKGEIIQVSLKREKRIDWNYTSRYAPNTEMYTVYLEVNMLSEDGETIYFSTPRIDMNVTNCPGAAVVTFPRFGDNPWLDKVGNNSVSTQDRTADIQLIPKIRMGDKINVKGRIKADKVSRNGKKYKVINYVKMAD